jgi:plasmid stability protein
MANVLLRGLDAPTLSRLRAQARRRGISVNRLIVETLKRAHAGGETFDDLDALAGRWSEREAEAFAAAVAPFCEIDAELWAAQPKAAYRVKRRPGRPRR